MVVVVWRYESEDVTGISVLHFVGWKNATFLPGKRYKQNEKFFMVPPPSL
jgi:hypothetical protein